VQSAGKTTHLLNLLESGDHILDVVGPLGKPSEIKNFGSVVVMGGGVGTAMAYPTAAALKRVGNRVIAIVGARNKELVILEREMSEVSDALLITTDDGSYPDKGFVTDKLRQLIDNGARIDLVLGVTGSNPRHLRGITCTFAVTCCPFAIPPRISKLSRVISRPR
jgi:ferredoxin/flavodoxin---NADP+ reductase